MEDIEQATDAPGEVRAVEIPTEFVRAVWTANGPVEHDCPIPDTVDPVWTCPECITTWQR